VLVNIDNNFMGNNSFSGNTLMGSVQVSSLSINSLNLTAGSGTCYYGFSIAPTAETYYYQQFGNMVTLFFPGISTTAGSTGSIEITGVSDSFQTSQVWSQAIVVNNGGLTQGVCLTSSSKSSIASNGSSFCIYVYAPVPKGSFTEENTVGFDAFSISFYI